MDDMSYVQSDPSKAKRSLWSRALWTLLGMLITLIVFAAISTQY